MSDDPTIPAEMQPTLCGQWFNPLPPTRMAAVCERLREHDGRHACGDLAPLLDTVAHQQERIAVLTELVREFVDVDPCHYDHHGYCQAHSLHRRPCPHERAGALLAESRR